MIAAIFVTMNTGCLLEFKVNKNETLNQKSLNVDSKPNDLTHSWPVFAKSVQ